MPLRLYASQCRCLSWHYFATAPSRLSMQCYSIAARSCASPLQHIALLRLSVPILCQAIAFHRIAFPRIAFPLRNTANLRPAMPSPSVAIQRLCLSKQCCAYLAVALHLTALPLQLNATQFNAVALLFKPTPSHFADVHSFSLP